MWSTKIWHKIPIKYFLQKGELFLHHFRISVQNYRDLPQGAIAPYNAHPKAL